MCPQIKQNTIDKQKDQSIVSISKNGKQYKAWVTNKVTLPGS
jgi:hypothetical protein